MEINVKMLEGKKACAEGIDWLKKEFGENAEIEIETVIKTLETQKTTKDWIFWLFETFKLSGFAKKWHENGQLWEKCNYLEGKLHGEAKQWYDNGQLWEKCNYLDGKLHGKCLAWYQDGLIRK